MREKEVEKLSNEIMSEKERRRILGSFVDYVESVLGYEEDLEKNFVLEGLKLIKEELEKLTERVEKWK